MPCVGEVSEAFDLVMVFPKFIGPNTVQPSLTHDPSSVSRQIGRYEFSFGSKLYGLKLLFQLLLIHLETIMCRKIAFTT